jgi:hypothetical protein
MIVGACSDTTLGGTRCRCTAYVPLAVPKPPELWR